MSAATLHGASGTARSKAMPVVSIPMPECCWAILGTARHVRAAHFQDTRHRPGWWLSAARWTAEQQHWAAEQAEATRRRAREQDRRLQAYDMLIVTCEECGAPRLSDCPHTCRTG